MNKLFTGILGLTLGLTFAECSDVDYEETDTSYEESDSNIQERDSMAATRCKRGKSCTTDAGGPGQLNGHMDLESLQCICLPISSEPHPNCGENQTCGSPA